jgi:hypothetical protein
VIQRSLLRFIREYRPTVWVIKSAASTRTRKNRPSARRQRRGTVDNLYNENKRQPGGHHAAYRFDNTRSLRHCGHEFANTCTNTRACNAAGAASRRLNAGCDAIRYSLWRIDRA